MSELTVVGKRVPRIDAIVKATGNAIFADDISVPGMLRGKILRSPCAHARILNIDISRAIKLPGVRAIVTGKDFPGIKFGFIPQTRDQLPFPIDKVRHVGEGVAAVAAVDEDIADEALKLIKVDYLELPPVLSIHDAIKEDAPLVHENAKKNIAFSASYHYGNVDETFAQCDYIREETLTSQRISHGFIEPHCILAQTDSTGKVLVQASKQSPYITWRHLCRAMDLPLSKVRMRNPFVGGAYSGKHDPFDLDFAAIRLAQLTGRPVKIVVDMTDILGAYRQRHSKEAWIKIGVKKDGTLMAFDCKLYAEGGAYACVGPLNMHVFGSSLLTPYHLKAGRYEGHRIYTTKSPCGALRGQAAVIARYVFESVFSQIADDLGIDQVEIRLKNALGDGDTALNGTKQENYAFKETIARAAGLINWEEKKNSKSPWRGIGFACNGFGSGSRVRGHWASAALVKVSEDGSISLTHGATEIGQGSDTVLAQIVAEELGVSMEDVSIVTEDTETAIMEEGVYSSRTTVWAGNAARAAAADAKRQLSEIASKMFEIPAQDIVFREGKVFYKDNPGIFATFASVAREADFEHGKPIYGRGTFGPDAMGHIDLKSSRHFTPGYGSCTIALEVEVDPETGMVSLLNSVAACDNGQVINPAMMEGQMEGGSLSHYGQAFFEECKVDEKGLPLNADFTDYFMPTAMEIPDFKLSSIPVYNPYGPFGAKGGGESFTSAAVAVAANAISDALGVRITSLPATPDKVLNSIKICEKKGTSDNG